MNTVILLCFTNYSKSSRNTIVRVLDYCAITGVSREEKVQGFFSNSRCIVSTTASLYSAVRFQEGGNVVKQIRDFSTGETHYQGPFGVTELRKSFIFNIPTYEPYNEKELDLHFEPKIKCKIFICYRTQIDLLINK